MKESIFENLDKEGIRKLTSFPEYENDDGEYVVPWRVFYGLDED